MTAPQNLPKARPWRVPPQHIPYYSYGFNTTGHQYRWALSKEQVQSTRLFSGDYAELADIAQLYQLSQPRPVRFVIHQFIDRWILLLM